MPGGGTKSRGSGVLAGFGLAYLPEDQMRQRLAAGRLIRVLDDWCAPFSGDPLYYPSRRQATSAFASLVDVICYRRECVLGPKRRRRGAAACFTVQSTTTFPGPTVCNSSARPSAVRARSRGATRTSPS